MVICFCNLIYVIIHSFENLTENTEFSKGGIMVTIEDFKNFEFVVAEVKEAKVHPNADRLLVLQINIGDESRQLVAGIKASYEPETLVGKKIVVIKNLQPATIRGEESEGMLLAATGENGPIFLTPEKDVPSGSRVS